MNEDEKRIREELAHILDNHFKYLLAGKIHKSSVLDFILEGPDYRTNGWGMIVPITSEPTPNLCKVLQNEKVFRSLTRGEKNWQHVKSVVASTLLVEWAHFYQVARLFGWPTILAGAGLALNVWWVEVVEKMEVETTGTNSLELNA